MVRTGRVMEHKDGKISVCFERPEACAACGACSEGSKKPVLVTIAGDADVGDTVDVEMPDAQVVKVSALVYVVPLCAMILGLFLGGLIMDNDWARLVGGFVMMWIAWICLHFADKKLRAKKGWTPRLVLVHDKQTEESK